MVFLPFFFFHHSEIPWRGMRAVGVPASPCFSRRDPLLHPLYPRSKSTGNQSPVFEALLFFPHLPVPLGIRLTSVLAIPTAP